MTRKGFTKRQDSARSKVRSEGFNDLESKKFSHGPDFTGISAPYEPPLDAELHIKTAECDVKEAVHMITGYLLEKGYIS